MRAYNQFEKGDRELKRKALFRMTLTLFLTGSLALPFNVPAARSSDTIYIRANGAVDPPSAPISSVDNITYTFSDNIYEEIVVERSNITVDGNGFMLQGAGEPDSRGIWVYFFVDNVTIQNMNIEGFHAGIYLTDNDDCVVRGNNVRNNTVFGIYVHHSHYGHFCDNNITNNGDGLHMVSSVLNNTFVRNNIASNDDGVILSGGYMHNRFYHNNFLDNSRQVYGAHMELYVNYFDNGYPSGGNYWSDYHQADLLQGPYQNITGYDGIGDTPYVIDENNTDRYPLIHPYGSVRNLDTNLTYLTIQSAIDAPETVDGHTIYVEEGIYYEHVIIDGKSLFLVGEDTATTIIDGNGTGDCIVLANLYTAAIVGFKIRDAAWDGIELGACENIEIKSNMIEHCYRGIDIAHARNIRVSKNEIIGNRTGEHTYGIMTYDIDGMEVLDNKIIDSKYGINTSGRGFLIKNNTITDHYVGISLATGRVEGNRIIDNHIGIRTWSSGGNRIFHNTIVNNTVQVDNAGVSNYWDNGCEGNYWSDYSGTDADGDGIGDIPYIIDANNTDTYPLMAPYLLGDMNHDGIADVHDLFALCKAFGAKQGDENWNCHCDLNEDGKVDTSDLQDLNETYGKIA